MRIVCAPDSFKDALPAAAAAEAMARGVRHAAPDASTDRCPIADGGEGTVAAMVAATDGWFVTTPVAGPLGQPTDARWGLIGSTEASDGQAAVIEMAAASGLELVPADQRDPTRTTSFGTGQLIAAALDRGARRLIVGIGGSATCDGGAGMAQALGARFFDKQNNRIDSPMTGGRLADVSRIDITPLDPRLAEVEIVVACDVTNPLTGRHGAAAVYAPQKGAAPAQVRQLEVNLSHLAALWRSLGRDVEALPGAGAAGGLGAGLVAFLNAKLHRGIDLVLGAVGFDQRVRGADLVLTGEGTLDGQSLSGKAVLGVAKVALQYNVPTVALVGRVGDGARRVLNEGLAGYRVIGEGLPADESMARTAELLECAAAAVVRQRLHTKERRL